MSNNNTENRPFDTLLSNILKEKVDINTLDARKKLHRDAFLAAIVERPILLSRIKNNQAGELLEFAIEENYKYFVHLSRAQYTDELAQRYMWGRLNDVDKQDAKAANVNSPTKIIVQKSGSNKVLLTLAHVTPDGEELSYFDNELNLPLSLKSNIRLVLKINNAIKLIDKLDTHITHLGEKRIKVTITDLVLSHFRSYLSKYIAQNNLGYYKLITVLDEVAEGFKNKMNEILGEYGIVVNEFMIKKIAIPTYIQTEIENLDFNLRQRRIKLEEEAKLAQLSLSNYEAKLAIQSKYPVADMPLTEYEKDEALARYLEKNGVVKSKNVDHSIKLAGTTEVRDSIIEKKRDNMPDDPAPVNLFRRVFCIATGAALLISVLLPGAARFIALGVVFGVAGTIAAFNTEKFKNPEVKNNSNEEANHE